MNVSTWILVVALTRNFSEDLSFLFFKSYKLVSGFTNVLKNRTERIGKFLKGMQLAIQQPFCLVWMLSKVGSPASIYGFFVSNTLNCSSNKLTVCIFDEKKQSKVIR